jgi:hypothetical protein
MSALRLANSQNNPPPSAKKELDPQVWIALEGPIGQINGEDSRDQPAEEFETH